MPDAECWRPTPPWRPWRRATSPWRSAGDMCGHVSAPSRTAHSADPDVGKPLWIAHAAIERAGPVGEIAVGLHVLIRARPPLPCLLIALLADIHVREAVVRAGERRRTVAIG